ncbi:tail assembly chaperone [Mycobacterium phage Send513]|uniref:Tail assembly chaperone n=2 Tax=Papyrusvirus send513 TaxID=1982556 RepID=G1BRK3_9CAUD|nr:tail assembly chaperone [Mycobacterium phage Send513]AEK07472.1 tail assembly chaperone [Mycobacterium phage Send513]AYQ98600.1 tail assembly chaperone [Mycobacterium phage Riparian]
MSYPGVDPTDTITKEPVGTQEVSVGETPTPAALLASAAGDQAPQDVDEAVKAAVKDLFAVNEKAWKPKRVVKFVVDCPSGQVALVKHLDTLDLIEHDLVEELDFFTRKLFPADIDASGNPVEVQAKVEDNIWQALRDPEKRRRFLEVTGRLMQAASIKPKIIHDGVVLVEDKDSAETGRKTTKFGYELDMAEQLEHFKRPIPPLKDGEVYSGYVDFADRMAFFQELNKPLGMIEPFREEQAAVLQDMARGEGHGGVRPSELWGISWPLAAFYFDRALRNWATFVDRRVEEAEMTVRMQMKNRKGTDGFALQARHVAFNKLMGLDVSSAYAPPPVAPNAAGAGKRNLRDVSAPKVLSAEGHKIDLSKFNG